MACQVPETQGVEGLRQQPQAGWGQNADSSAHSVLGVVAQSRTSSGSRRPIWGANADPSSPSQVPCELPPQPQLGCAAAHLDILPPLLVLLQDPAGVQGRLRDLR